MEYEREASAFIEKLATEYFVNRDMDAVGTYLEERTSWIGTGKGEVSRSLEEAAQALAQEAAEYGGSFRIVRLSCDTASLCGPACVVYGTVTAVPADPSLSKQDVRFTAVTEGAGAEMRLLHLHFSHPDGLQEAGRYFVPRSAISDNQSLRMALDARGRQLENLMKNIPGGVHQCSNNPNLTLLSMSDGFLSMFGYTSEEIHTLFHDKFINMVYPGDRAEMIRKINEQLQNGPDIEVEYRVLCKSGQPIWILDKGRLLEDGARGPCFYCLLVEINDRKRQQEELRLSLERHQVIMDQAADIIFEWDIRRDALTFSQNWRKKFGYDAINQEISGRIPLSENIHPEDMPAFVKIMRDTAAGVPYSETEFRIRNREGRYLWCRIRATTQYDENRQPIKAVGVIVDIDAEKQQNQALREQAQLDALTGLYNKAAISTMVERRMQGVEPQSLQALLIIDVDHFKAVNDTYGHLCGDGVLSDVAAVLKQQLRASDLAGRIGGDEFLVYLPEVKDETTVRQKAEKLLAALRILPPKVGASPVTCSIGAAVFPHIGVSYHDLYKYADIALYHRKSGGRDGVTVYDHALCGVEVRSQLRTAVDGESEGSWAVGQMAQYAFRILYTAKDTKSALQRLLEIIGRSYNVGRAYIFESSGDGVTCSNTFEWCSEGIPSEMEKLQNLSYLDDLNDYQKNFDETGLFYCADVRDTLPGVRSVLEPQGIRSMLQCAMLDEGAFVGYVGFDECRTYRAWSTNQVASFKLTADVLSTFLIKLRQRQRLTKPNVFPIEKGGGAVDRDG